MAVLTAVAAGGQWNTAATWSPEQVPTAADDVVLAASSGSVTLETTEGKCRSLEASEYKKTLALKITLALGTSTSNGGLGLKLGAGMTLTVGAAGNIFSFISTSGTIEKITTAGIKVPALTFNGTGGKWELQDKCSISNVGKTLKVSGGELKTGGQEVVCGIVQGTVATLTLGASKIVLEGEVGQVWLFSGTLNAGTSTIEVKASSKTTESKFLGGGKTYNVLKFTGNNIQLTGSNTVAELLVNTAAKAALIKGTTVEKSKTLTMTEGTLPSSGEELKGTAIPTGTTVVKIISEASKTIEMSAEATSTVGVAETIEVFQVGLLLAQGSTQTVEAFQTNGKAGELARLASNESGKAATLKRASGSTNVDYMILKDSHATGGIWYAGAHSTNATGNEGWLFEAGKTIIPCAAAASTSGANAVVTAPTGVPLGIAESVSGSALALSATTQLSLATAASTSGTSLALTAPTSISLTAGVSTSSANFSMSAPALLSLGAGASVSSASLSLSVITFVVLQAAEGSSSAGLALSAPTVVSLGAAGSVSAASLGLSVPASISLASSASESSGSLQVSAPTQIPLSVAQGASSATLGLTVPTGMLLGSAGSTSSAVLSMFAPTFIVLQVSKSTSEAGSPGEMYPGEELYPGEEVYPEGLGPLRIMAPTTILLGPAQGTSAANMSFSAPTRILLGPASSITTANLVLSVSTLVPLGSAGSSSSASLSLYAPALVILGSASSMSSAMLGLTARTRILLSSSASVSSAAGLILTVPTGVSLSAGSSVSSAGLLLSVRTVIELQSGSSTSSAKLRLFIGSIEFTAYGCMLQIVFATGTSEQSVSTVVEREQAGFAVGGVQ